MLVFKSKENFADEVKSVTAIYLLFPVLLKHFDIQIISGIFSGPATSVDSRYSARNSLDD